MNDNPWWCPHCRVGVDNRGILQDMRHVFCGNQIIPMETLPDRDKLIADLEAQLAAMTTRAEKAEAERVEVFDWVVMCDSGEVVMRFEESIDGVESMYQYLKTNHMIREAE